MATVPSRKISITVDGEYHRDNNPAPGERVNYFIRVTTDESNGYSSIATAIEETKQAAEEKLKQLLRAKLTSILGRLK